RRPRRADGVRSQARLRCAAQGAGERGPAGEAGRAAQARVVAGAGAAAVRRGGGEAGRYESRVGEGAGSAAAGRSDEDPREDGGSRSIERGAEASYAFDRECAAHGHVAVAVAVAVDVNVNGAAEGGRGALDDV